MTAVAAPLGQTDTPTGPVSIRVLGSLEVAGETVPTARLPRKVLALLALHPGDVLSCERIGRELWDGRDPDSSRQSVQSYMMRLRRIPTLREPIVYRHPGYTLRWPLLDIDAHRYTHYVSRARSMMQMGDVVMAEDVLRAAASLWGDPLVDVECGPLLSASRASLMDYRLTEMALGFEVALRSGRHRDVVDELYAAVRAYPGREDLAELLLIALYRCSRRAEAADAYRAVRAALAEEYGLEPCPRLQRLHSQILAGDPELEAIQ